MARSDPLDDRPPGVRPPRVRLLRWTSIFVAFFVALLAVLLWALFFAAP